MNDLPRQKLCELIAKYGESLCDAPLRLEGLLRDLCGEHRREIHALVDALKERVAAELLTSSRSTPIELLLGRLTKRLQDNRNLTGEAARWAVESWALALGKISAAQMTEPKETIVAKPAQALQRTGSVSDQSLRATRKGPVQQVSGGRGIFAPRAASPETAVSMTSDRRRTKKWPWVTFGGVALLGIALAAWYFQQQLATERSRREQIEQEQVRAREEAQKRDQELAVQTQMNKELAAKQSEEERARTQKQAQEQRQRDEQAAAAKKAEEKAAAKKAEEDKVKALATTQLTPSPAASSKFDGVWKFRGGFEQEDMSSEYLETLVIRDGNTAVMTEEHTLRLKGRASEWDATMGFAAPYVKTREVWYRTVATSEKVSVRDSTMSIRFNMLECVDWRPRYSVPPRKPRRSKDLSLKLTGKDKLTEEPYSNVLQRVK